MTVLRKEREDRSTSTSSVQRILVETVMLNGKETRLKEGDDQWPSPLLIMWAEFGPGTQTSRDPRPRGDIAGFKRINCHFSLTYVQVVIQAQSTFSRYDLWMLCRYSIDSVILALIA